MKYQKSLLISIGIFALSILLLTVFTDLFLFDKNSSTSQVQWFETERQHWKSKKLTYVRGDLQYRATEVPVEYYFLKNLKEESVSYIDSIVEINSSERIIEFEFEHYKNKDLLESTFTNRDYDASVNYMSSRIREDFSVVTASNDTIPCAGVHFERHLQISPFNRVLLYFGNVPTNETIQLIYQDNLFQNGTLKFNFDEVPFKT